MVNSRLSHFSAPCSSRVPLSLSYGVNLPSSLAMIHSSTSGFSPSPPVSVYGTGCARLCRGSFSRESTYRRCRFVRRLGVLSGLATVELLTRPSSYLPSTGYSVSRRACHSSVSPLTPCTGNGMFTICPSDLPFRVILRPRLTLIRLTLFRKPGGFGVRVSVTHCRYLCLHLLFRSLQQTLRSTFSAGRNAPLPLSIRSP